MNDQTGVKARAEYLAIRLAAFVLQMFPIDLNLRTARWIGRILWRVDGRHRKRIDDHLRASFGAQLDDAELRRMSLACVEHWAMWFVEFLCAFRLLNEWSWSKYIKPVALEEPIKLLLGHKGAILLTGHYGNFELTAYTLAAVGFDVAAVMRPLDNRYVNDFVVRTRSARGLRLLDKKGVATEAEDILKQGGAIGLVADQDAGRKGVFVDFFGRKASTYKSIALLAMRCEVPILIGFARRCGKRFQYEASISRVIAPDEWRDRDDPVRWITQEYTTAIEAFVREAPEQYLWIHRRWKSRPRNETTTPAATPSGSVVTGQ